MVTKRTPHPKRTKSGHTIGYQAKYYQDNKEVFKMRARKRYYDDRDAVKKQRKGYRDRNRLVIKVAKNLDISMKEARRQLGV